MKTIKETNNGRVFMCGKCDALHVEYKNLNFNLTNKQFNDFSTYLNDLDGMEWENRNADSTFTRKIIVPTQDPFFNVILNNNELRELRVLFACSIISNESVLKYKELLQFTRLN